MSNANTNSLTLFSTEVDTFTAENPDLQGALESAANKVSVKVKSLVEGIYTNMQTETWESPALDGLANSASDAIKSLFCQYANDSGVSELILRYIFGQGQRIVFFVRSKIVDRVRVFTVDIAPGGGMLESHRSKNFQTSTTSILITSVQTFIANYLYHPKIIRLGNHLESRPEVFPFIASGSPWGAASFLRVCSDLAKIGVRMIDPGFWQENKAGALYTLNRMEDSHLSILAFVDHSGNWSIGHLSDDKLSDSAGVYRIELTEKRSTLTTLFCTSREYSRAGSFSSTLVNDKYNPQGIVELLTVMVGKTDGLEWCVGGPPEKAIMKTLSVVTYRFTSSEEADRLVESSQNALAVSRISYKVKDLELIRVTVFDEKPKKESAPTNIRFD